MPIEFACPQCGHQTTVADRYAGESGPCAACGTTVRVPTRDEVRGTTAYRRERPKLPTMLLTVGGVGLIGLALLVMIVVLLSPLLNQNSSQRRVAEVESRLQQIGLAMLNYEADYGSFPPAYIADEEGKPMHSWRVLLLPYLGETQLHSEYRFDEPWDGPNNSLLQQRYVEVYHNPVDEVNIFDTSFMVIVGAETMFPPEGESRPIREVRDGLSNTIMVVEVAQAGVSWMEPIDLDFDEMPTTVNDPVEFGISSLTAGGASVLMADGSVRRLSDDIPSSVVRAALTSKGGEVSLLPP